MKQSKNKANKIYLKYNIPIGITNDFQTLLDKGLSIYSYPSNLVKLSKENSLIVEDVINHDDRYRFSFSKIVFDNYCVINPITNKKEFKRDRDSYIGVLRMIDIDNSTQVFKNHRNDFYRIIDYITNNEESFLNRLNNGDINLVDDLINICDSRLVSFNSKICKYLNKWIFNKDDYYVLNIIPYYLEYYRNNFINDYESLNIHTSLINDKSYNHFYNLISKIHYLRNIEFKDLISKDHLDHIMWYSYRSFAQKQGKIKY